MATNSGVVADVLYVGVTRPALALGVPYSAVLINAFVTLELFLLTHNLLWVLVCVPLHLTAWLVCLAEPRYFELLALWAATRAHASRRQARSWGAHSYSALAGAAPGGRYAPTVVFEVAPAP